VAGPMCIVELCLGELGGPKRPTARGPAVVDGRQSLSYQQLLDQVQACARGLAAAGVRPGDRVAVSREGTITTIVALLGVMAAEATFVPIFWRDADTPPIWIDFVLVTASGAGCRRTHTRTRFLALEELSPAGRLPDGGQHGQLAAYLMPTSGSTGARKVVGISRASFAAALCSLYRGLKTELPTGAGWSHLHSFDFGFSMLEIFGTLLFSGCMHVVRREAPLTLASLCVELERENGLNVVCLTPSELSVLIDRFASQDKPNRSVPTHIILSGERVGKRELIRAWRTIAGVQAVINTYAATETSGQIAATVIGSADVAEYDPTFVGRPLPGIRVRLRDQAGSSIPPADAGTVGEICVSGPTVAIGYVEPAQSSDRFVGSTLSSNGQEFLTHDLGRWDGRGGLHVLGRSTRQVKVGGRWIDFDAVEDRILEHPYVREVSAAPIDLPAADGGVSESSGLGIAVALTDIGLRTPRAVVRTSVVAASATNVTIVLRLMSALPRLPSGKRDRNTEKLFGGVSDRRAALPTGGDEFQSRDVVEVWHALLGDGVAMDVNLFELGLDSLGLTNASGMLSEILGRRVAPETLLDNPTIRLQVRLFETWDRCRSVARHEVGEGPIHV
jgi:acyl-CoA synthetase (AMP-forming)/AMP-acid ligase II